MVIPNVRVKIAGFSLLEVLLAITIISVVAFLGIRVINIASEHSKNSEEIRMIHENMQILQKQIKEDFESMVLLDKEQTVFEVFDKQDRGYSIYFFTSGGENHLTIAVKYEIAIIDFGKIEVSREALSESATLAYQQLLTNGGSLSRLFESVDIFAKRRKTFCVTLSDFKIRPSVKTYYDSVVFAPSNANMRYSGGTLLYNKRGKRSSIAGDLFFFDITMRALTKSDFAKLEHLKIKNKDAAKDFLFSRSKKQFFRVMTNSSNMK